MSSKKVPDRYWTRWGSYLLRNSQARKLVPIPLFAALIILSLVKEIWRICNWSEVLDSKWRLFVVVFFPLFLEGIILLSPLLYLETKKEILNSFFFFFSLGRKFLTQNFTRKLFFIRAIWVSKAQIGLQQGWLCICISIFF